MVVKVADSLSPQAAISLGEMVELVNDSRHVKWADEEGTLSEGTLRYFIADEDPHQWHTPNWERVDVRDAWVRVTMRSGFERAIPFADLLKMYRDHMLVAS